MELKSYKDVLVHVFHSCETDEERWNRVAVVISNLTVLVDVMLHHLPNDINQKIINDMNFDKITLN